MHELADTQRILEVALQYAQTVNAKRIVDLNVVLGHESHISDESVRFYWSEITRGTLAEGSTLRFQYVPGEVECLDCGSRCTLSGEHDHDLCRECRSPRLRFAAGEEFYLDSIEIEKDASPA